MTLEEAASMRAGSSTNKTLVRKWSVNN